MQDTFIVSEPKRYFKREREMQIFLFESNIVFTKREEISPKHIRYVYKDSMLVFFFFLILTNLLPNFFLIIITKFFFLNIIL